jgi:hypothetical protein
MSKRSIRLLWLIVIALGGIMFFLSMQSCNHVMYEHFNPDGTYCLSRKKPPEIQKYVDPRTGTWYHYEIYYNGNSFSGAVSDTINWQVRKAKMIEDLKKPIHIDFSEPKKCNCK